jgi:tetratricopeptide (TPR) repeat protein
VKIASPKINSAHLTANDTALLRCKTALEQKDRGDYEGAQEAMRPLWTRVGERPKTAGLDHAVAAEVLLCVGILTSWIGSKNQIRDAQELAKNLITQAMTYFEASGDAAKVAVAQSEIAYCYYREGTLNEARSWLRDALNKLTFEGAARARALLKLTTVECSAAQFHEALELLNDNEALFRKITNHTIKGGYHSELAIILRNLATSENKPEYFRRAINEYKQAETQFRLAHNPIYRADVINNVGFLLYKLGRYKDAHKYLNEARRVTVRLKDKARTAQIDDSLAQVLTAEGRLTEADRVARRAASSLRKAEHFCMMAETLITQGIAVARRGQRERAEFIFRQAIKTAHQVNALNIAGLAALSLAEEVADLSPATLQAAYRQAREWLANSQSPDIKLRLGDVAERLTASIRIELSEEDATEILLSEWGGLREELLKHEGVVIKRALAQADGSVTRAAKLLGIRYQSLAFIIENRHGELLKERRPIRRRQRKKVNTRRR